jgi:hypothetical protein
MAKDRSPKLITGKGFDFVAPQNKPMHLDLGVSRLASVSRALDFKPSSSRKPLLSDLDRGGCPTFKACQ